MLTLALPASPSHDAVMRNRVAFDSTLLGLLVLTTGCTSLDHQPGANLMERRPGTVVTDDELQARGEWTDTDHEARRLLGTSHLTGQPRGQVRLASQERALCDVVRVGRHELVLPSVSSALTRLTGMAYEPRYYRTKTAWILLRRDEPAFILKDDPQGPDPDDASPAVFNQLGRDLQRQVEALNELRPEQPTP